MEIVSPTVSMTNYIVNSLRQKKIPFITVAQVLEDIAKNRLYVLTHEGKPVAMCAVVYDEVFGYYAIKRLVIFQKKNKGKHYADTLISHCTTLGLYPLGCTPWVDNTTVQHLLEKHGFSFEYIFDEKWCFFQKSVAS